MDGLYQKIIKGAFAPIPDSYSKDLDFVVRALLTVNAAERPDCIGILNLP
jgi:hypothetical protein